MGISIEGVVSTKLGLASHQNAVPLLRRVTIANDGAEGLDVLVLEIEASLPFASSKSWRIDRYSDPGSRCWAQGRILGGPDREYAGVGTS